MYKLVAKKKTFHVELTIKEIGMHVQHDSRVYFAWKRGSKGTYEQSPFVEFTKYQDKVQLNHVITRETVFFMKGQAEDLGFQKKTCDFYLFGRNSKTNNKVVQFGCVQDYDMTPHVNQGKR